MTEDSHRPDTAARRGDYHTEAAAFQLDALAARLHGSLENGINACVECCDRYADDPARVALVWESQDGRGSTLTFAGLKDRAARFANFLRAQGVGAGDVVAGMLPRTPDLLVTILGTWRAGAVYQPLFTAFGPKAIEHRLATSQARLVVTDSANRSKLDDIPAAPPVAIAGGKADRPGDFDLGAELDRQSADFAPVLRRGDDLFMMLSTSGTTGLPKGVPVPLKALLSFRVYMTDAVDLRPEDRFWNIADPGWAYFDKITLSGMTLAYAGAALRWERKRDSMALRRRSWRWLIRATSASLPSGLRGRVSFSISTMSRGVSNSRPG